MNQALINNQLAQAKIYKRIAIASDLMEAACKERLVHDNETAELIGKGFDLAAGLSPEDKQKFKKMTAEEAIKYFSEKAIKDGDLDAKAIASAQAIVQASMDKIKSMLTGEKLLHSDGLEDQSRYSRTVMTGINTVEDAGFDMGWTAAFTAQDAQDVRELDVMDLKSAVRWYELLNPTDEIPASKVGGKSNQKVGPRFFGSRLEWHERQNRWNVFTLNNLLSAIRMKGVHTISQLMYRILFQETASTVKYDKTIVDGYADFIAGADGAAKDLNKRILARKIMNAVHFKMVNQAAQLQPDMFSKKYQNLLEAPIQIGPNDPILFFYNHQHFELMDTVGNPAAGSGDVRYNVPSLRNWVPIQTAMAPVSGSHTITGGQTSTDRDDYGFLGQVSDVNHDKIVGGMAVIPGRRNMYGIFRGMTFLSERHITEEYTSYVARQEYNAYKDMRQYAHVTLIDHSEW